MTTFQNHLNDLASTDAERIDILRDRYDLDLDLRWIAGDEFEVRVTTEGGVLYFYSADEVERWVERKAAA
jgi:hypothetical protein